MFLVNNINFLVNYKPHTAGPGQCPFQFYLLTIDSFFLCLGCTFSHSHSFVMFYCLKNSFLKHMAFVIIFRYHEIS